MGNADNPATGSKFEIVVRAFFARSSVHLDLNSVRTEFVFYARSLRDSPDARLGPK
jgi:hypothetical protein